jgi:hypothetical protein
MTNFLSHMFGEVFGKINVETPKFALLKKTSSYEIRQYPRLIRATVETPGADPASSGGFRWLANYIFGANEKDGKSEPIAMTAPVLTEPKDENTTTMSFVLPSKYTNVDELPMPKDSKVKVDEVPEATYAVATFTGVVDFNVFEEQTRNLRDLLLSDEEFKEAEDSKPVLARYNPPWSIPVMRTNELMLKVEQK